MRGKAAKPFYIWIKDGDVEIRDGWRVWGLDIADAEKKIREEVGDRGARTTLIGPAARTSSASPASSTTSRTSPGGPASAR